MCGSEEMAGQFLNALASGSDSQWPVETAPVESVPAPWHGLRPPSVRPVLSQAGSRPRSQAEQVRSHFVSMLGAPRANALLRAITRGGRMHPGLAPRIRGTVVGTEETQVTPAEKVREVRGKLLHKMIATGYIETADIGR
jgi:hypothetical protein